MGNDSEVLNDKKYVAGLVELSKTVGAHTADIEKLKKDTGDIVELRKEISEVKTSVLLTNQNLGQMVLNYSRLEKVIDTLVAGTVKFRYFLWSALGFLVVTILGTLGVGMDWTEKNQAALHKNLQSQITKADERHTDNYKDIIQLIRDLRKDINK